jgi:cyclic pyranopterin phosphate synthase
MKDIKLSHLDESGYPRMVDVSQKKETHRTAWARAEMLLPDEVARLLNNNEIQTAKGPVFQTAIIAGTMAAKNTATLIPLAHPLPVSKCVIDISTRGNTVIIDANVSVTAKTGVEMEALAAAAVAALTVYDMCKALSHNIIIREIKLMEKTGGKQDFKRIP